MGNINKLENSCQGLHVKCHLESISVGLLFPTVIIYSMFKETEIPTNDVYVYNAIGLAINAHLDARNQDKLYVYFMRNGVKQLFSVMRKM